MGRPLGGGSRLRGRMRAEREEMPLAWGGMGCGGAEPGPLQDYMDPMNEFSALNEAKQMIAVADENQNHCLEPEEVLKYSEFFTGSKLVDYARSVHEEF